MVWGAVKLKNPFGAVLLFSAQDTHRYILIGVVAHQAVVFFYLFVYTVDNVHSLLYIRVSTDEQAEKGFSQRNQEEMLRKYCSINQIQIRNVIYEDHSAKTFNRPQWKKILADVKKNKNKINLVLFMKWDRFSRNAGDAYQMINVLRKLGIEPQAIEQPLDLSVPENKMMLAFYLAAPEVENDRRAINTFQGLRRGKKEGRHMGMAPYGYANKITEDGKKYIAIVPDKAAKLIWIFEQVARNVFSTESIYQMAKDKGLVLSKSNLWVILRNPLYCGKIVVPKYRDEEERSFINDIDKN